MGDPQEALTWMIQLLRPRLCQDNLPNLRLDSYDSLQQICTLGVGVSLSCPEQTDTCPCPHHETSKNRRTHVDTCFSTATPHVALVSRCLA